MSITSSRMYDLLISYSNNICSNNRYYLSPHLLRGLFVLSGQTISKILLNIARQRRQKYAVCCVYTA